MVKNMTKWPILLIALDLVGAIIAAVGILKFIENGSFNAFLLIVVGFCLMLPLILHILKPVSYTHLTLPTIYSV